MKGLRRGVWGAFVAVAAGLLAGCPGMRQATAPAGGTSGSSPARSGGKVRLAFWHTRRSAQEKLLQAICAEYNRAHPEVEVAPEYQGDYSDLAKKTRAAIQAKALPALSVCYESNVSEYAKNDVVAPLDRFVRDPTLGFSPAELADFPDAYLKANRFPQFKDQLLSFPFTKSNLMLYYNADLLKKAGFTGPPQTWAQFEEQSAAVTRQLGKPAFAFTSDASTLDGMIYSFGGEVLAKDGITTLFDQPPAVTTFELLQRMSRAKTLTELSGDDAGGLFQNGLCAFVLSSTSTRPVVEREVGTKFGWDLAMLPHAEGVAPVTVMYGPNICIFRADPTQEAEAWKFVRYFVSPEVTARWARETGYLPVRRSAVDLPEMKRFYQENPRALHAFQAFRFARSEPNALGWQEVRDHLQEAASSVVGGTAPATAAVELKKKSDRALSQSR